MTLSWRIHLPFNSPERSKRQFSCSRLLAGWSVSKNLILDTSLAKILSLGAHLRELMFREIPPWALPWEFSIWSSSFYPILVRSNLNQIFCRHEKKNRRFPWTSPCIYQMPSQISTSLSWWITTFSLTVEKSFLPCNWKVLTTVASLSSWQRVLQFLTIQEKWSIDETKLPIDISELRAVRLPQWHIATIKGARRAGLPWRKQTKFSHGQKLPAQRFLHSTSNLWTTEKNII